MDANSGTKPVAAQHAFDVFTSIRSAHVVRAIHRYLIWHHTHRRVVAAIASTG